MVWGTDKVIRIETKADIGQTVFYMDKGKAQELIVEKFKLFLFFSFFIFLLTILFIYNITYTLF